VLILARTLRTSASSLALVFAAPEALARSLARFLLTLMLSGMTIETWNAQSALVEPSLSPMLSGVTTEMSAALQSMTLTFLDVKFDLWDLVLSSIPTSLEAMVATLAGWGALTALQLASASSRST